MDPKPTQPKPDYVDYLEARGQQGCAGTVLWIGVVAVLGLVAIVGGLLRVPFLGFILAAIGVCGIATAAFIGHDTNLMVRLMRERAAARDNAAKPDDPAQP